MWKCENVNKRFPRLRKKCENVKMWKCENVNKRFPRLCTWEGHFSTRFHLGNLLFTFSHGSTFSHFYIFYATLGTSCLHFHIFTFSHFLSNLGNLLFTFPHFHIFIIFYTWKKCDASAGWNQIALVPSFNTRTGYRTRPALMHYRSWWLFPTPVAMYSLHPSSNWENDNQE